jgi:DNA polymerase-4
MAYEILQDRFEPDGALKWLFLDLNSYFASVEQQENPALRGRPVAVVPMMTDGTCAIAASYEAKAYGIKTGTKIYEAKRMCPDLVCILARHDKYVEYHHRILAEIERHLHIDKICSIDEVACRLLGRERDTGAAIALAHEIKRGICATIGPAITCSIGIAPNAFLAKIASDMQKPDGLVVLEQDQLVARLSQLDLLDLPGINVNMQRRLWRGGVGSVAQLLALEPKQARRIWGSVEGERFWYKLHGYGVPDRVTQKRVVGHSRVLDINHRRPDIALDMARRLTVKAATRLRRYGLYAGAFDLSVRFVNGYRWVDGRRFSHAQDNFVFLQHLQEMWACATAQVPGVYMKKVSICLHSLSTPELVTGDLFEAAEQQSYERYSKLAPQRSALSAAMDRLNKRYGVDTVRVGEVPETQAGHVGTKIAFSRIPDQEEFWE